VVADEHVPRFHNEHRLNRDLVEYSLPSELYSDKGKPLANHPDPFTMQGPTGEVSDDSSVLLFPRLQP